MHEPVVYLRIIFWFAAKRARTTETAALARPHYQNSSKPKNYALIHKMNPCVNTHFQYNQYTKMKVEGVETCFHSFIGMVLNIVLNIVLRIGQVVL